MSILREAFGAGWGAGYKAKGVEPDWIDEEYSKWCISNFGIIIDSEYDDLESMVDSKSRCLIRITDKSHPLAKRIMAGYEMTVYTFLGDAITFEKLGFNQFAVIIEAYKL